MGDDDLLGRIEDLAATGASLSTIDASLKFTPNTMSKLLQKGKEKRSKKYYQFYLLFRSWAAEAKHAAEANLAKRSPDKWLDRSTTAKMLESEEDMRLAHSTQANTPKPGVEAAAAIEALKILRRQGISIDDALDKDTISVNNGENDDN